MIVLIPRSAGFPVYPEVEQSLLDQDIPHKSIMPISGGVHYDLVKDDYNKCVQNICDLKNECLRQMKMTFEIVDEPCACILDADEMFNPEYKDSLVSAEAFLINNSGYSVVGLSDYEFTDTEVLHNGIIRGCCWIYHRRFFDLGLEFQHGDNSPEDRWMTMAIRGAGSNIRYLDGKKRLNHLKKAA
jgi:hypothetical protein